jgi:hypothetical protein
VFFLPEICVDLQILPALFIPFDFPHATRHATPPNNTFRVPHDSFDHLVENFSVKSLSCDFGQLYYGKISSFFRSGLPDKN